MKNYKVYILSDSIGETAEAVAKAAVSQFVDKDIILERHSHVETPTRIDKILKDVDNETSLVIFTIVLKSLHDYLLEVCKEKGLRHIDVMSPAVSALSDITGSRPTLEVGAMRRLTEEYFERVKAVEFAVKYDDGKDPRGVLEADCVLIGVSRTSKTPLSMYLAHKNIKVANIPLVPEIPVPKELYEINPDKIICLMNDKSILNRIRRQRLKEMGLPAESDYANISRIDEELKYAKDLVNELGCKTINVADKAIEESCNIILRLLKEKKRNLE